jgi:hypothetical protein
MGHVVVHMSMSLDGYVGGRQPVDRPDRRDRPPPPVAVAGTPTALSYDGATRELAFAWDAARPDGGRFPPPAVTSVSVPALSYPDGYTVEVEGARVTSDPCATTLTLTRLPSAWSSSIRVVPGDP